jgi:hypothetical protein
MPFNALASALASAVFTFTGSACTTNGDSISIAASVGIQVFKAGLSVMGPPCLNSFPATRRAGGSLTI